MDIKVLFELTGSMTSPSCTA